MFNWIIGIPLLTLFASVALVLTIIPSTRRETSRFTLNALLIVASVWAFCSFMLHSFAFPSSAFWVYLIMLCGLFTGAVGIHFCIRFTNQTGAWARRAVVAFYVLCALPLIPLLQGQVVTGATLLPNGAAEIEFGPMAPLMWATIGAATLIAIFIITMSLFRPSRTEKRFVVYTLVGYIIMCLGSLTNVTTSAYPVDIATNFIFLCMITYTVISRYALRQSIRQTWYLYLPVVGVMLALCYVAILIFCLKWQGIAAGASHLISAVAIIIFSSLIFSPSRTYFSNKLKLFFFPNVYRYQQALGNLAHVDKSLIRWEDSVVKILDILVKTTRADAAVLLIRDTKRIYYEANYAVGHDAASLLQLRFPVDSPLVKTLNERNAATSTEEIGQQGTFKVFIRGKNDTMREIGAMLGCGIQGYDGLLAIVALTLESPLGWGRTEDKDFLELACGQIAPIIINANLYQESLLEIEKQKRMQEALKASETRYRTVARLSSDFAYSCSNTGSEGYKVDWITDAFYTLSGYSKSELYEQGCWLFASHPDDREMALEPLRYLKAGESDTREFRIVTKDGRILNIINYMECQADPQAPGGLRLFGAVRNTTERKKAEERYKLLAEHSADIIYRLSIKDECYTYVSPSAERILGYTDREVLSLQPKDVLTTESYEKQKYEMVKDLESGMSHRTIQLEAVHKDGHIIPVEVHARLINDEKGQPLEIVGVVRDITERKQAEEALKASEERFHNLVENAPTGIVIINSKGQLVEANAAIWRMHGNDSKEEYMQSTVSDRYYDPKDRERWFALVRESGKITDFIVRNKRKDGSLFWASVACIRQTGKSSEPQYITVIQDITQQKQAEDELKESEERYRALVKLGAEVGEAVIMLWDTEKGEGVHAYASEAWAKITGYSQEELQNTSYMHLAHPRDQQAARERGRKRLRGEAVPGLYEVTIVRKDGTEVPVEVTGASTTYQGKPAQVIYIRDITRRKKMEEQLMAQDRLASIGQLVSGVAHELNNPLTSVTGFSELLLRRELPSDIKHDLKIINDEANRTASIVRNLLTFARNQPKEKAPLTINENIKRVLELRAYEHKTSNIQINAHFEPDLPQVVGNGSQLQQVFFNVIINAEFSMIEAHGKGTLTITTEKAGNSVRARFTDDGPGISPENMRNIFNPFFTTKGVGKGTGLGLSICHGIITEHGGKIWAESELGKGATFIVELPVQNKLPLEKSSQ